MVIVQTETLRLRRTKMTVRRLALFLFSFVFFSTVELGQVKHVYSTVRSFHPSRYGIQLVFYKCSVNAQHLVDTLLWDNMSECVCVCVCVWKRQTETLHSPYQMGVHLLQDIIIIFTKNSFYYNHLVNNMWFWLCLLDLFKEARPLQEILMEISVYQITGNGHFPKDDPINTCLCNLT